MFRRQISFKNFSLVFFVALHTIRQAIENERHQKDESQYCYAGLLKKPSGF